MFAFLPFTVSDESSDVCRFSLGTSTIGKGCFKQNDIYIKNNQFPISTLVLGQTILHLSLEHLSKGKKRDIIYLFTGYEDDSRFIVPQDINYFTRQSLNFLDDKEVRVIGL